MPLHLHGTSWGRTTSKLTPSIILPLISPVFSDLSKSCLIDWIAILSIIFFSRLSSTLLLIFKTLKGLYMIFHSTVLLVLHINYPFAHYQIKWCHVNNDTLECTGVIWCLKVPCNLISFLTFLCHGNVCFFLVFSHKRHIYSLC